MALPSVVKGHAMLLKNIMERLHNYKHTDVHQSHSDSHVPNLIQK